MMQRNRVASSTVRTRTPHEVFSPRACLQICRGRAKTIRESHNKRFPAWYVIKGLKLQEMWNHNNGSGEASAHLLTGSSVVQTRPLPLDFSCLGLAVSQPSCFLRVAWQLGTERVLQLNDNTALRLRGLGLLGLWPGSWEA
ncbi:hypothetical protein CSKR_100957 [Clonorchis sinensis]|uniref:Uncharacterized protein n=1 Tax=Clonorchis sinensis TaxID=79923 RepID=A0A3R7EZX9_CLOSI|nr:hypothetical protein CSKR_100957 [Clonorchis sinensis]